MTIKELIAKRWTYPSEIGLMALKRNLITCPKCGEVHSRHALCDLSEAKVPRKPLSWTEDGFMQIDLRDAKLARLEFQDMLLRMAK